MKHKLLIVEDDGDSRELLAEILSGPEYEVVTASSVAEAARLLKVHSFKVLLLDGCLGDGEAWDVLEAVPEEENPKVILITGSERFDGAKEGESIPGIDAFFRKPCSPRALLLVVRTLCRG